MLYDELKEIIRQKWRNGTSQTEIAASGGISQVMLNHIINGDSSIIGRMQFDRVRRLWPELQISLPGDKGSITQTGVNSIQAGRDIRISDASGILRRVRRALLNADMCDKCKLAAISAIMAVETEEE